MDTKPFVIAPRAMLCDAEGRYLFLRRSAQSRHFAGHWEPPGGKMDAGEAIDQALIREVLEETGLGLRDLHVVGAVEGETPEARYVAVLMEAQAEPGEVQLCEEHDAFVWATPAEAARLDLSPIYVPFVKSWAVRKGPPTQPTP